VFKIQFAFSLMYCTFSGGRYYQRL